MTGRRYRWWLRAGGNVGDGADVADSGPDGDGVGRWW